MTAAATAEASASAGGGRFTIPDPLEGVVNLEIPPTHTSPQPAGTLSIPPGSYQYDIFSRDASGKVMCVCEGSFEVRINYSVAP